MILDKERIEKRKELSYRHFRFMFGIFSASTKLGTDRDRITDHGSDHVK